MAQLAVQNSMGPNWCHKHPGLPTNRPDNIWDTKTNLTVFSSFRKRK